MSNFSTTIATKQGALTFYFLKVDSATPKYFVQLDGCLSAITAFDMKQDKWGRWKVLAPAPAFIKREEARLAEAITTHEAAMSQ